MKKFKKLIPAMCMLLVSAVMLGSSTFAWFSMNNKVTATGMEVTAKANTQYFVISSNNTSFENDKVELALTAHAGGIDGATNVYPVSYLKEDADANTLIGKIDGGKYTGTENAPKAGDWYTANSMAYDNAVSDKLANVKKVDLAANNYFVKYTFYVGLAANSSDFTGTLTFTAAADTSVNEAVNAVIVVKGNSAKGTAATDLTVTTGIFSEDNDKITTTGHNYYLSATAGAVSYVTVEVYAYVDGANAQVKDSNIAALTGKFKLTVEGNAN